MRHRTLLPALIVALIASPVAASDLWFHLRVDERSDGNTKVRVNVPLAIVEAALPLIPKHNPDHRRLEVNGREIQPEQFRGALRALRNSAEDMPVTIAVDGENVVFSRRADVVFMDVEHHDGERAVIRMPFDLAEALVAGEGNEVDMRGAARALVRRGAGELLTVATDDSTVRMWIDDSSESH